MRGILQHTPTKGEPMSSQKNTLYLKLCLLTTLVGTLLACSSQTQRPVLFTKAQQQAMTPADALARLKEGNLRYTQSSVQTYNQRKIEHKASIEGQAPYAMIINCVDSRSIPEIVFNESIGTLFVGSVAGNVLDTNLLGSSEYATKYAGSKLIVIMGHTSCGAVHASCAGVNKPRNLKYLLSSITPAVMQVQRTLPKAQQSCDNPDTIGEALQVQIEYLKMTQRLHFLNRCVR